jgi:hypothetical protein
VSIDIDKIKKDVMDVVKDHEMTVVKSDGLNRCLRFANPKCSHGWFDVVTWHGCLCIHGDYGTYVFVRLPDMFDFFKDPINPSYWAEKVVAVDRDSPIKEFSKEKFEKRLRDAIEYHVEDEDKRRDIWMAVEDEILLVLDDDHDGRQAMVAVRDFSHPLAEKEKFEFVDFFEHDLTEFSLRYIWNLHAIVWAIDKFNKSLTS